MHHLACVFPIRYCQASRRFYPSLSGSSRGWKGAPHLAAAPWAHTGMFYLEQINTQGESSVWPGAWGPSDRTLPEGSQYLADLRCSWVTPSPHCPIWSLPEGHLPEGQRWHSRWPLCYSGPQCPAGKWCRHMHGTIWLAYPSLQSAALWKWASTHTAKQKKILSCFRAIYRVHKIYLEQHFLPKTKTTLVLTVSPHPQSAPNNRYKGR